MVYSSCNFLIFNHGQQYQVAGYRLVFYSITKQSNTSSMKFSRLENFIEAPINIIEVVSRIIGVVKSITGTSPIVNGLAARSNNVSRRVFGLMNRAIEEA